MIDLEDFSVTQKHIISQICVLQLQSLKRLYNGEGKHEEDITLMLIQNEISEEEFKQQLIKSIDTFTKLQKNKEDLSILNHKEYQSIFRHILTQVEDRYKYRYPKAVKNLWNRLFILEKTQEFNLN